MSCLLSVRPGILRGSKRRASRIGTGSRPARELGNRCVSLTGVIVHLTRRPRHGGRARRKPEAGSARAVKLERSLRSPFRFEMIAGRQLQLRLTLHGGFIERESRGKRTDGVYPFAQKLPVLAELVRPRECPGMTVLVARRSPETAQLVSVELVVAAGQPLAAPFVAAEREGGAKSHVEQITVVRGRSVSID